MKDKHVSTSMQAYPLYDLAPSLDIGEAVHNCGGTRVGVHKSQIAAHIKLSETSSTFDARMGTARSFGVITGRGEYTLTESAQRYFSPMSEADRKEALLSFLLSPPAFAKLVNKYDGTKIPTGDYLANVFASQFGVGKSWASRVANIFAKTAEMAGVLDSHGFLRYEATLRGLKTTQPLHTIGKPVMEEGAASIQDSQLPIESPSHPSKIKEGTTVWAYKSVRLETPETLTIGLWEKLRQYVEILKPDDQES